MKAASPNLPILAQCSERGSSSHLCTAGPYPALSIPLREGRLLTVVGWGYVSGMWAINQEDWKHCQFRKVSRRSISS